MEPSIQISLAVGAAMSEAARHRDQRGRINHAAITTPNPDNAAHRLSSASLH